MVVVDTLCQFSPWIELTELKLPIGTMVFEEEEGMVSVLDETAKSRCCAARQVHTAAE